MSAKPIVKSPVRSLLSPSLTVVTLTAINRSSVFENSLVMTCILHIIFVDRLNCTLQILRDNIHDKIIHTLVLIFLVFPLACAHIPDMCVCKSGAILRSAH